MRLEKIIKRDGTVVAYDRDRITTAIFRAMVSTGHGRRGDAEKLALKTEEMLVDSYGPGAVPSVEEIQDIVEQSLMAGGYGDVASAYMAYRRARAQARAARAVSFEVTDNIPYKKLYETLKWNIEHDCESVEKLNKTIIDGKIGWLARESERQYLADIEVCAEQVLSRRKNVKIVVIAGPSSSGKTTSTICLSERLASEGLRLKAVNIDNYFFDRELHPKDEFGDYDYEKPQSLDLELINLHLRELLAGKTVMMPSYDFKAGIRTLNVNEMKLDNDEILLIDSLHGLYGDMTRGIETERVFKLYVETLSQLRGVDGIFMRWADIRLMRRMIRDSVYRNSQPMATLTHWHYVRRSELQYIIPFISSVDCIINTSLAYEAPVLKKHIYDRLPTAVDLYRDDSHRQDAYIRAKRLKDFLEPLQAVEDDSFVPGNSLLREFIGGSVYSY